MRITQRLLFFFILFEVIFFTSCSQPTAGSLSLTDSPEAVIAKATEPQAQTPAATSQTLALQETISSELDTLEPSSVPTLKTGDAPEFTKELMTTNNNCDLPCWWGITPGETTWDIASQFLASFVFSIDPIGSTTILEDSIEKDLLVYSVPFTVQGELEIDGQPGIIFSTFYVQNNQVHTIETPSYGSQEKYLLPEILKLLGQPHEALIKISEPVVVPTRKISLVFLFPDNGVVATYRKDIDISTEPQINICFEQEPDLRLQSRDVERNIADFKKDRYIDYKLLKDVVEISLEDLLDYIQETGEPCFDIINPDK